MAESYSIEAVLSARDEGFTAGMKAAMDASNSLGSKLKSGLGFGALMAIGNKAVSSISNGISGLVGEMSESSAAWKTFQGNMEMNKHTQKDIQATKRELQEFAEDTIYSSSDMASTFAQLDAVGTKHTTKLVKGFGGLAAAAENPQQAMKTLSQQATQAAAKPTIQWMDFKLMLEQTPAGMSAVAKQMGMSTSQLIKNVQDGKVKTKDFFDAIAKVGTNENFTKLATEYKTVGQAMDGLTETASNKLAPAFDVVSGAAIKGISGIVDFLGNLNGDALASQISALGEKVGKYWNILKTDAKEVGSAFGSAISAIGKSLAKLNGSFGSAKSVSGFKSAMDSATSALNTFAGFCKDHSDAIAKLINILPKLLIAYKGFKIVKGLVPGVGAFSKAITSLAGKGISALAGKLFGVSKGEKSVGSASMESSRQTMQAAKSFMMLGVGVMTIAIGFGIMAASAIALADAGGLAIGVMVGLGAALAGMLAGMTVILKTLAPISAQLMPVATAFIALGVAVLLVSAGFAVLAAVSIQLADAGTPAIACMVGMAAAIALLAAGAAVLGPALTAGAIGFIAFGAAIVLVGVGAVLAASSIAILASVLPTVAEYGLQGAVAIAALGAAMIVFAAGAALAGVACVALGAGLAVLGAGFLAAGAGALVAGAGLMVLGSGMLVVSAAVTVVAAAIGTLVEQIGGVLCTVIDTASNAFTKFSEGITNVVNAISGGLSSVLDSIAGVIRSIGESAKNAGQGFKSVAEGIKMISGLSLGSIIKSLGAVAIGIGKISKKGADIQQTANGMRTLSSSAISVNASFVSMGAVAAGAFAMIRGSMNGTASAAKSAGQKTGNGFSSSMQSGLKKASSVAASASKATANKLRSGYGTARSAGAYISQGFASGMSSCLGQIRSAAAQMVAAADAAIRAKAKIHSPSRLTKSHGLNVAIGLALGIRKGIKSVTSASKSLISAAANTLKKATKTRQYEDVAKSAIDKFKSSMDSKTSKTIKSLDKQVDSAIKTLKKKNPKLKKQYDKVGKILKSDISKQIKKQGEKAISAADKALTALGEKYQEKYDKIASDRDNYLSKLSDYGNLYSVDSYGFVALKDFKAQTSQVKALGANLEKLKKVLPYDLMRDIQDMDTASGLAYTNELLKKGDAWLKQYGKDYSTFISTAKSTSNKYYQPYIDQIDKEYSKAVTDELKKLQKKMNTIGSQATSGFIKGLTSKSSKKALKKAASDLASILTKSVKGKLKIHSPSRVFAAIGEYVGKGFVNGIDSMKRKVAYAMDKIVTIPNVVTPVLAGGYVGDLSTDYEYYRNTQYTIVVPVEIDGRECARVTAPYTEAELNKRQARDNRKHGRR